MENGSNKKRAGRPKARPQTGPLVLEGSRAREKLEIELGDATADELKEYTRWVELSSSLATGDAVFTTVDYALRELFRRDRLWQAAKRGPERQGATSTTAPAARSLPASERHGDAPRRV
jgi:hypothetical protein